MTTTVDRPAIAAPAAQPAPLRLSEAIRLGSLLSLQCKGRLFDSFEGQRYTCAIGSALDAAGLWPNVKNDVVFAAFPLLGEDARHPVYGHTSVLQNIIVDLNDQQGWKREAIADYVESVEKAAV